jgi:signal transduction histidine kinase/ligand-binding sensor domain-containing protein
LCWGIGNVPVNLMRSGTILTPSSGRGPRRGLLLLTLALFCCPRLLAIIELSEYQKQEWQVEDGLPQSQLRAITQVPGGHLLIGTYGGMASFDGLRFNPIHVDVKDDAASEAVNALLVSRRGDIWIGTDGRGIIRQTARGTVNVSEQAGLSDERVRGFFEDSAGNIWAATQSGVERISVEEDSQSVHQLTRLGPVSGDIFYPFAEDGHGGLFILTSNGLFHSTAQGVHKHVLQQHQLHHQAMGDAVAIYHDRDGSLWVGLRDGLLRLNPSIGHKDGDEYSQQPIPGFDHLVTTLTSDHDGNLWVGTRNHGLCRVTGVKFSCWSSKDGLADDYVRSFYEDDEHNLWIGLFSGGLSRWRAAPLVPLRGEPRDLTKVLATNMLADHADNLWIGTWGKGLYRLQRGKIHAEPFPGRSTTPRAMAEDAAGNIWIGTWFDGLFRYSKSGFQHFLLGKESVTDAISALLFDHRGSFWVGTYTGLLQFTNGLPATNGGLVFLKDKLIVCLVEDRDGSILVGTASGLYRIQHEEVQRITGLSHNYVQSLSIDSDGNVWAGTKAGGLDWIKGGHAFPLRTVNGMVGYTVFTVLDDGRGFLWMGTSRGILRVQRRQLEELAQQKRTTLDSVLLGKADGMLSSECVGAAQPPSARMQDGTLWFATAKGLVHTNPADVQLPGAPSAARVTGLTLGNRCVNPASTVELPPGLEDLVIEFNSQNLANPAQMQFRYKLAGYDSDWTVTKARGARYRKLPPGHYRFLVNARNAGSPWNDTIASIAVLQRPYFYQSWWFYLALLGLATATAIRVFRWKLARAKGQLGVVLEERNRIAREWHDTLMAGFAAIAWQMETAARLQGSESSAAAKALDLARNMVRHCQTEARRILWDLRENEEATGPLSSALTHVLTPLGAKERVDMQLRVEGKEVSLSPGYLHHLVCIGQEAVTNALRHAEPKVISVHLRYRADSLSLSVKDDGCGFRSSGKLAAIHGHFGIPVMEERARKIGGSLRVETTAGSGTEIFVEVPFEPKAQGG